MNNEEIIIKYKKLVYKVCNQIYRNCYNVIDTNVIDIEDLVQWGYLGLINANKTFKEDAGVSFINYASLCISNKVKNEVLRKKQVNTYLELGKTSLDDKVELGDVTVPLKDVIGSEDEIISVMPIVELIDNVLSEKKADIVKMHWIERMQMNEIAQLVGCTPPNISSIISSARKKILKYYY